MAKTIKVCYPEKMLQIFNQNYEKILKKIFQQFGSNIIKASVHFMLFVYWLIIITGTFLMLN